MIALDQHFLAKNWLRRVKEVEKVLDCYKDADIMGFQEVGIGGNIEYSHCGKWSKRRGYKADYLSFVPRMKLLHQGIFARILDFFYMARRQSEMFIRERDLFYILYNEIRLFFHRKYDNYVLFLIRVH